MKIIAKTDKGYLIEADRAELTLLHGYRSSSEMSSSQFDIGAELNIAKMARTSEFIRTMDDKKLQALQTELEKTLQALIEAREDIHALTVFDKLAQQD